MVEGQDGPTPLVYHEPHWNTYYRYIIYNISFMNSSSDFIVQTAPVWVKMQILKPSPGCKIRPPLSLKRWCRQQQQCPVENASVRNFCHI